MAPGIGQLPVAIPGASAATKWEDMPIASLGGVEFPIGYSRRDGGHSVARHRYDGADSQETEGLGRTPFVYELTVPLYASVNAAHYPGRKKEIEEELTRDGGRNEYIDPEDGPVKVRVISFPWHRDPMRRDGGYFQITLEEHRETIEELIADILADPLGLARAEAEAADAGLEAAGIADQDLIDAFDEGGYPLSDEELDADQGSLLLNMVDTFFTTLESGAMAFNEVSAELDAIRWRINRVKNFSILQEIERWQILHSLTGMAEACSTGAEKSYARGPSYIEWTVPAKMSSVQISNRLYSTPNRAEEIEEFNPVRNPLYYPKGMVLTVLSE